LILPTGTLEKSEVVFERMGPKPSPNLILPTGTLKFLVKWFQVASNTRDIYFNT
jgi:hypothetical protein